MKVFITGASGFIGHALALAFRRAGHRVYGLCRSGEKAALLDRAEVHPVLGDISRPETYAGVAEGCSVLVHAAADAAAGMVGPDRAAIDTLLAAARRGSQPRSLLYTSGVWVYGSTGPEVVDETSPLQPFDIVNWRPVHERLVLEATGVKAHVLRPGCVYGGRGSLTGLLFEGAFKKKSLQVVGDGRNHWAMVHLDDVADAYVRVAASGTAGEVWNVTDRSRDALGEMAAAAARAAGYTGEIHYLSRAEAAKTMGGLADALAADQHVESWKAASRLGWTPKHGGFVDGAAEYFRAWKAFQA
jgi:nucleoside-diphosphate-sugar epimerase